MKVLDLTNCNKAEKLNICGYIVDNNIKYQNAPYNDEQIIISDFSALKIKRIKEFRREVFLIKPLSYDLYFDADNEFDRDYLYWSKSYQECKDYIDKYNGTDEKHFKTYKGGYVSIYCNELADTVFETEIK